MIINFFAFSSVFYEILIHLSLRSDDSEIYIKTY